MAEISPLRRRMIDDMTVRNLPSSTQRSLAQRCSEVEPTFRSFSGPLRPGGYPCLPGSSDCDRDALTSAEQIVWALRFFHAVTLVHDTLPERIALCAQIAGRAECSRRRALPRNNPKPQEPYRVDYRLCPPSDIDPGRAWQGQQGSLRSKLWFLRTYWLLTRPKRWLYPGRDDERPLVPNVLHAAFRSACVAAGLSKSVAPISWPAGQARKISRGSKPPTLFP
ncbi:hypothetical protein SAMN05216525_1739 [Bradyrhizobium sp. Gha]|nr:hypothetical protein SAMN05216525_1739 [Bradyrhizobium sp. Gha]